MSQELLVEIMRSKASLMAISSDLKTEQKFGLLFLIFAMASGVLITTPLPVSILSFLLPSVKMCTAPKGVLWFAFNAMLDVDFRTTAEQKFLREEHPRKVLHWILFK